MWQYMVEGIQSFGVLSRSNRSVHYNFKMNIKQALKITLQRRLTQMMKTIRVVERSYEKVLRYQKKKKDGRLKRENEKSENMKRMDHVPYVMGSKV